MDRAEKLEYEQSMEKYFDEHKIYDLFEKLFKELIINQPDNPIDYLIERLKRQPQKRIFISGWPGTYRKEISLRMSSNNNDNNNANVLKYTCSSVDDMLEREISKKLENSKQIEKNYNDNVLVDDEITINKVRDALISYEEKNDSYIIDGFPKNRVQAIFLQSVGLLPDNVIILKTTRERAEKSVFEKLKERNKENNSKTEEELKALAKASVDEAELNIRAVEDVFNGFFVEIPVDQYEAKVEEEEKENEKDEEKLKSNIKEKVVGKVTEEIGKLLKFKSETNSPKRPPRIILACPPALKKEAIAKKLANKLQIIHISVKDLLKKEILMKNANSQEILNALDNNELVPDKFVLKLLEDRLFSSDCMINGWIVTGFPMNESQINYIEKINPAIKPNLIALIDAEEKDIKERAEKIRYDPMTGVLYKEGGKKYTKLTEDVKERLVLREQDSQERLAKRIENWKKVSSILMQMQTVVKTYSGDKKKKNIVEEIENDLDYGTGNNKNDDE